MKDISEITNPGILDEMNFEERRWERERVKRGGKRAEQSRAKKIKSKSKFKFQTQ